MARMTNAAKLAQTVAQREAAMAALTAARDGMIAAYESLQAAGAAFDTTEPLCDAINNLHDRIADMEKIGEYVRTVTHDPILDGTFGDPMHY